MSSETESGKRYFRNLPHFRAPGKIYHVRFSVRPSIGKLREPWMFELVESSILFAHKKSNLVFCYVIMENHVHLVIQPLPKTREWSAWCDYREFHPLETIIGKLKGYTGLMINRRLGRHGQFWMDESF